MSLLAEGKFGLLKTDMYEDELDENCNFFLSNLIH
jgi:hypothetical protein